MVTIDELEAYERRIRTLEEKLGITFSKEKVKELLKAETGQDF